MYCMWKGLTHTASNSYYANVRTIFKMKNWKATIFQKPLHFFFNSSCISTILGLQQGFDQQNSSGMKIQPKNCPDCWDLSIFQSFPIDIQRLWMSGTLELMSKNFSGNYFAVTSGKFVRKTHDKHLKANMRQTIVANYWKKRKILQNET